MILTHDLGKSLELGNSSAENPLWRYVYSGKPKPYFHPLCTPAGHLLTLFEPHDHFWHRGLWFTIKYVNGENFWEENDEKGWGIQRTLAPPNVTCETDGVISISSRQDWIRPGGAGREGGGSAIFREQRQFIHRPLSERAYALDFEFILNPLADVLLDRTVFTTWGGYGGLTFRGNRNWQETRLLFSDGTTSDRPTGIRADWCDLSGKIDGAPSATAGIAIFDHPKNLRHPTPWYGGTGPGHYFNAAFLFHEPMKVAANQPLSFQYRVLVHDGIPYREELQKEYDSYAK
jgi:hypothetical protein